MTKKGFVVIVSVLTVAVLLAGCGRPSTVREYMEANPGTFEEFQSDMQTEARQMSRVFGAEILVDVELVGDHEIAVIFVFNDPNFLIETDSGALLADAITQGLDADTELQHEMAAGARNAMRVNTLYFTHRYLDINGNVLAERTFAGQ